MKKEVVIKVEGLQKSFNGRQVLKDINIEIYRGETFVIMGGSGCGKSTLLRHLIGSLIPDKGSVTILGKDISTLRKSELDDLKKHIGMSFQGSALFDSMTVGENVSLALREHTKLTKDVIDIMVKMKLDLVGLRGFENLMPSQLSGGMKKRVGIARAFAMDPQIVFYDEPTAGLDPIVTAVMDKLVDDLAKALSVTSIIVTHDMSSVFRVADRIAMLYEGKVLEVGTKEQIQNSKNPYVQQFVSGSPDGPIKFFQDKGDYLKELTS
ncbi:MAG: ABC transporter ATP-binding protein [Candidatus Omnitrophica bacterium]|nr:ABC transporter ATP-binding protein [Candidatus Omnitrophota bacterium]